MGIRSDLQTELRNLLSSDVVKGKVAVQRAYADWRRYPAYIVPLSESSIDLIFAPAYGSSKKNATDIRLAVDAIELVFTRPEIGTYILLSGDSDFSSLVLKLKEYGKYVIGVGIRESSSDLLVQNCDEYYSYTALAGLIRTSDEEVRRWDPWELVVEAVGRMARNGDVMRADRLKQVMQEVDPNFDEGNLGMAKFSKFCLEAAQRGLLKVTKLENGQLEVAATDAKPGVARKEKEPASVAAAAAGAPAAEKGDREGRVRRGRRGRGRDRERGPAAAADQTATAPASEVATPAPDATAPAATRVAAATSAAKSVPAAAKAAPSARTASAPPSPAPVASDRFGLSGQRLSRDDAFTLIRQALSELVTGDTPVASEAVREKVHALLGRDSESLSQKYFGRILKDAHDASVVDVRKRGDSYEIAPAAKVAPVAEQLGIAEKAHAAATAEAVVPAQRSMSGRRPGRGKASEPPADLLSVGVVELDTAPVATPELKKAARKPASGKASAKTKEAIKVPEAPKAPAKGSEAAKVTAKKADTSRTAPAAETADAKPAARKKRRGRAKKKTR